MSDETTASMFDYDARPVTPQVVLGRALGVLRRLPAPRLPQPQRRPLRVGRDRRRRARPRRARRGRRPDPDRLPICVLPDGSTARRGRPWKRVATGLGMVSAPSLSRVRPHDRRRRARRAGRRGLRGVRGSAHRGRRSGGAGWPGRHDLDDRELPGLSRRGSAAASWPRGRRRRLAASAPRSFWLGLSSTSPGPARATWLGCRTAREFGHAPCWSPSGVDWRRLEVPGLDELLGAGVYYGAGPSEAVSCRA